MQAQEQVWIVDDDSAIRWVIEKSLASESISCSSFSSADSVWQALEVEQPQAILSDVRMPGTDGISLLERIQRHFPDLPVIIMTAHSDLDSAVTAYQAGAFEYLPKPFDIDEVIALVKRALARSQTQPKSEPEVTDVVTPEIIGEAPAMQDVFRAIGRLSRSSMSVLIHGQSGTGKELVARALHKHSPRAGKPFVALNMAAIPKELIEAELFGHEKGAFTGATEQRKGWFEQASGGTLFLDEIGDMPLEVQTRLLRVLAEGSFYRVGANKMVNVDVRIIAATHQNLLQKVEQGDFREDLFHRLNVIQIELPALNQRREDIPALVNQFLNITANELGVEAKSISTSAMQTLVNFDWPGNVRQLENTCRWLTVMAASHEVLVSDLPIEIQQGQKATNSTGQQSWQHGLREHIQNLFEQGKHDVMNDTLSEVEQVLITEALKHTQGHKQEAAKVLGCGRNTLTRKLKEIS
ncbi:nitrogen regulation protein NR(I) [Shewanella sp. 202IG2-18]|uniref:nitrogen regulation protein NR(I) n=1 Tax=Parashewanella hymeniacidonis TaxID=2807618 RepID=UPI0019601195|nr:nitrogen regulation protein NR(I) [Parashewanella hymeniacidonis]MBM7072784.1 nitrogen regulation protein NR(I) [Parashewanella hymeniacidonis]